MSSKQHTSLFSHITVSIIPVTMPHQLQDLDPDKIWFVSTIHIHAQDNARLLGTAPLITPRLWRRQCWAASYSENCIFFLITIIIIFLFHLGTSGGGESGGLVPATTQTTGNCTSMTCT